jgi:ethanolamine ammonia-lyase small subunit
MKTPPDDPALPSPTLPSPVTADPWTRLAALTPARLALGRAGPSLPTREVLKLGFAHARARDAVHAELDVGAIAAGVAALGCETVLVESAVPDRATYLRRPDVGRRLSARSRVLLLQADWAAADVAIVVADGLSASAVDLNALPLLRALTPLLAAANLTQAPVALARQARVALGDEIGALLGARLVLVLIGERPGLSAADSLGAYLTFAPKVGRRDAERNCVSNIRVAGLGPAAAAGKIAWLITRALALGLTGVALKDDSEAVLSGAARASGLIDR